MRLPLNPTSLLAENYSKDTVAKYENTYVWIIHGHFILIVKEWKQPKCLSMGLVEWIMISKNNNKNI